MLGPDGNRMVPKNPGEAAKKGIMFEDEENRPIRAVFFWAVRLFCEGWTMRKSCATLKPLRGAA